MRHDKHGEPANAGCGNDDEDLQEMADSIAANWGTLSGDISKSSAEPKRRRFGRSNDQSIRSVKTMKLVLRRCNSAAGSAVPREIG